MKELIVHVLSNHREVIMSTTRSECNYWRCSAYVRKKLMNYIYCWMLGISSSV